MWPETVLMSGDGEEGSQVRPLSMDPLLKRGRRAYPVSTKAAGRRVMGQRGSRPHSTAQCSLEGYKLSYRSSSLESSKHAPSRSNKRYCQEPPLHSVSVSPKLPKNDLHSSEGSDKCLPPRDSGMLSCPDPAFWTVEDVMLFIREADPQLGPHADLFKKHEIDGKALLLLRSEMMMKYMGLKLGPALKLSHHIDKIKQVKF